MIITNISNAILRNTQNLAKVSIFGGFAYGFIQTMKSGESALVPTSRWVSSHVLSSSQHKGGKEERNSAGEEKPRRRRYYDATTTKTMDRAAAFAEKEWNLRISSGGE